MRIVLGLTISTAIVAAGSGVASASPSTVAKNQEASPVATNVGTQLEVAPGTAKVVEKDAAGDLSLEIPGNITSKQAISPSDIPAALFEGQGQALLNTELPDATISTFATASGSQSIIKIDSASAATEYRFPLEIPARAKAKVLKDGSVEFSSQDGAILGSVLAPWAHDANGASVPTSFTIDGTTLVQRVAHTEQTAFPVVADPSTVWGWTVCVATVGTTILPWGAGAKVAAKLITRFGSVKRGIEIIYRAYHAANGAGAKWNAAMAASGGLFAEILGINGIKDACFS
ncbi:hypothetical protein [Arthrobacter sp. ERGS1:01]|uniref:hypothetical protein n=1 Tax=Arthrobacter sp. ERGS1:01 TaxID=1704044 RepID=UPI0006B562F5|nr:hypothetical protein [Arthrobacter sp. ERGS1:01]